MNDELSKDTSTLSDDMPGEDVTLPTDDTSSEEEDSEIPEEDSVTPETVTSPTASSSPKSASIDSLDIKLTFEVGEKTISINELKSLQSGFSFEFNSPTKSPITIRANGKAIGTGELLQIGDKVGVRVIEFFDND